MMTAHEFADRYYELLTSGDVDGLVALYADGAEIIRYDGVATTRDEIAEYYRGFLGRHRGCSLQSIDQMREADDVAMWDAMLGTDDGVLQVVEVIVFDDEGAVLRHVPGIRGYWGL